MKRILCINAGGIGDLHGLRARRLTRDLRHEVFYHDVDKSRSRLANHREIWGLLRGQRWDLIYQESAGIAGGAALIRAARSWGQPYVISTGDPVGGYVRNVKGPLPGALFGRYERLLYRHCAGFVGWTPYLTGAALRMGARRAVTVEGAVDLDLFAPYDQERRARSRRGFGIPDGHLVCGVVGSFQWNPRQAYCYGLEMVASLKYLERQDVCLLLVGDGTGRRALEERVPPEWRSRVLFTGRVPEAEVVPALNAMDVGFITQTLDGLGSYRLTTKLPEYLATGLPVAMSPVPGFFDYAYSAGWSLPPLHPASDAFHRACARWLDGLSREEVEARRPAARQIAESRFDDRRIAERFHAFIEDILGAVTS